MVIYTFGFCKMLGNSEVGEEQVSRLVTMEIMVFWVKIPCSLIGVTNVLEEHSVSVFKVTINKA
jgi:hypothetical protein